MSTTVPTQLIPESVPPIRHSVPTQRIYNNVTPKTNPTLFISSCSTVSPKSQNNYFTGAIINNTVLTPHILNLTYDTQTLIPIAIMLLQTQLIFPLHLGH